MYCIPSWYSIYSITISQPVQHLPPLNSLHPGRDYIYGINMGQPVPYLLSMSIFVSPAGTISTVWAFVHVYQIGLPWKVFESQPGLYLQYHRGSACTTFAFHQYVLHPQPVMYLQYYHMSACTTFASLAQFLDPGQYYIYSITMCWPVPHLPPLNSFSTLGSTIFTVSPWVGLYHICFPWVFLHLWPVPYLQYQHLSACTTFASSEKFLDPAQDYIYSITKGQLVPHLPSINMFCIPGQSCIYSITICQPVPHLPQWIIFGPQPVQYLQYYHESARTISTVSPRVGLYHICLPPVCFASLASHVSTVLPCVSLYHICLPCIVFGPRPVLYLQYYHVSACTTFASIE